MALPSMSLERAVVAAGSLEFEKPDGLARALRDGCFYLAVPQGLDVEPGRVLCREFYRDADEGSAELTAYRGFAQAPGIYFDREHFQTEHLLLDRPARLAQLPTAVVDMCEQMSALALVVLKATLGQVGVRPDLWDQVTDGSVSGGGTQWFAASHYRPERDQPGCAEHKDTGFVTILYIEEEGLEAWIDGAWVPISPLPGHFLVNYGASVELLTEALDQPVRAILHHVRRCFTRNGEPDRFSFAAFTNPTAAGELFRMTPGGAAAAVCSVEDFLRDFNQRTWKDRYDDFGIVADPVERPRVR